MKRQFFFSLPVAIFCFFACNHEKLEQQNDALTGTYIGKTTSKSESFKEIFTSPTMSHYDWVSDSAAFEPDTLMVTRLSADSFQLSGRMALTFPEAWLTYGFKESGASTEFTFTRNFSLPGYFNRQLTLTFNPLDKTLNLNLVYDSSLPLSSSETVFSGSK